MLPEAEADSLRWSYNIPVLTNKYVWIAWLRVTLGLAVVADAIVAPIVVATFAGNNGGAPFVARVCVLTDILILGAVVGTGLIGSILVANGVSTRFILNASGAVLAADESASGSALSSAILLGSSYGSAVGLASAMAFLLPSFEDLKWNEVRRVDLDEPDRVISLRRRWHFPLRIYVPEGRFSEVAAFIRERTNPR